MRVFDRMHRQNFIHTMIGAKLAHYEITSHLGSGGMGDVYQATDTRLGRNVAIKVLPEAFTHDSERLARFEREARVLASLNHPQIAAIYGLEESGGRSLLVMELVEGETLADRIARGRIPVAPRSLNSPCTRGWGLRSVDPVAPAFIGSIQMSNGVPAEYNK